MRLVCSKPTFYHTHVVALFPFKFSSNDYVALQLMKAKFSSGLGTAFSEDLEGPLRCACSVLELDNNEAAVSLALVKFSSWPSEGIMLAVGTTQSMTFNPRQVEGVPLLFLVEKKCSVSSPSLPCLGATSLKV